VTGRLILLPGRAPQGRPLTARLRELLVAVHQEPNPMQEVAARLDLPEGEELTTAHVRRWLLIEASIVGSSILHEAEEEAGQAGDSSLPIALAWAGQLCELLEELDRVEGVERSGEG
jgi:hypothetical protein